MIILLEEAQTGGGPPQNSECPPRYTPPKIKPSIALRKERNKNGVVLTNTNAPLRIISFLSCLLRQYFFCFNQNDHNI